MVIGHMINHTRGGKLNYHTSKDIMITIGHMINHAGSGKLNNHTSRDIMITLTALTTAMAI